MEEEEGGEGGRPGGCVGDGDARGDGDSVMGRLLGHFGASEKASGEDLLWIRG